MVLTLIQFSLRKFWNFSHNKLFKNITKLFMCLKLSQRKSRVGTSNELFIGILKTVKDKRLRNIVLLRFFTGFFCPV